MTFSSKRRSLGMEGLKFSEEKHPFGIIVLVLLVSIVIFTSVEGEHANESPIPPEGGRLSTMIPGLELHSRSPLMSPSRWAGLARQLPSKLGPQPC